MTWVVFDYGGVVCTYQPDADVAALARAAGVGVPEFRDAYWAYRVGHDRAELDGAAYWAKVAAALGRSFPPSQTAELIRLDIASWLHLRAGTVALIEDLAAAGHRLALLSNAPAEIAEVVAALPVARHFWHCAFSCHLRAVKPEPDCYRAVLAMLGARPAGVVFFDDRPENVAGAMALGIHGVHFTTPEAARTTLAAHGVPVPPREHGKP